MGDRLADAVGEGGGAPLQLGGFQQVAAGFVEDHAAEAVGEHHRQLAGLHVIGVEHGGGAAAEILGGIVGVPVVEGFGAVAGAVAAPQAGAVFAIGGQHAQPQRLVQAHIAGEGAVAGGDQHLLPVAGVVTAAGLQVVTVALQPVGAEQQLGGGIPQPRAEGQPVVFALAVVSQGQQALETAAALGWPQQAEHAQGLVEGLHQAGGAEVVGAHEAVALAQKHPQACPHAEGGADAGDRLLLGQYAEVIGALEEHLHQIGAGGPASRQKRFEAGAPERIEPGIAGGAAGGAGIGGDGQGRISEPPVGSARCGSAPSRTAWPSPGRFRPSGAACEAA